MQAILVNTSSNNIKQLNVFCEQFYNQPVNVYIYNSTLSIIQKQELSRENVIFIPKALTDKSVEIHLLKYAMQFSENTHFHLINEYSFIFPNITIFNKFFNSKNSSYISITDPNQWSITLEVANYIIKHYNDEEYIINIIKDNEKYDIVNNNLRYTKGDELFFINIREYIFDGILNKLILHNIVCEHYGYDQLLLHLRNIYKQFTNE